MRLKRIATIILCMSCSAVSALGNDWETGGQTANTMPSSGDWTYNYLIQSGGVTTRRVNAVLDGGNTTGAKTVTLTGSIMLRHSVFVGLSSIGSKPTTLIINNGTDDDIYIWDDLDDPKDGFGADRFMTMFSVWEGCTLIIDGDPDNNGKGKIIFGGNANNRGLITKYGFIESTGNLELKDVIIEHIKFDETNANAGECSVLKIHPWYDLSSGWTYEQGYTKLTNCEIRNITMPGGVGAVMYCYLITQNKDKNNSNTCAITLDNVSIHDVTQGSNSNDGNGGIIRFRGDWVGNFNMNQVNIYNCTSGASSAGVYWNALGRSTDPCQMTVNNCIFQNNKVTAGDAGAMMIEGRARFTGDTTKFIGNSCSRYGGAVYIHNYNSTDTPQSGESFSYDIGSNVYFSGNSADHGGGLAIYIDDNSTLPQPTNFYVNMNGAVFDNNTATSEGGAMKINLGTGSKNYNLALNINSGLFSYNSAPNGGAIYSWRGNVSSSADGTCTFTENKATQSGSAIFVNNSDTFTLKNVEISENEAGSNDGAVYVTNTNSMVMENGTIQNNKCGGYGAGIFVINSTMTLNNGTIKGNTATCRGGGIYLNNSTLTINNGQIINNTATNEFGGGVGVYNSSFTMNNGHIDGNIAGLDGGGVCAIASNFSMSNGNIDKNIAGRHGGGIYFGNNKGGEGNAGVANRRFSFSGGSISHNKSGGFGGGVCIYTGSQDGCSFNLTGGDINYNVSENGGGVYVNGWAKYTMNLLNTNIQYNDSYVGGGVLVYNAHLYYKNGLIRFNRAKKREGKPQPTTMYQVNHCDNSGSEDIVNPEISGIGGGIHATWGNTNFDTSEGKFGIYSNIADYGADDIFTNAKSTSINLPDPVSMDVVGFEVPKENQFWAQDYIEGDTNYDKRPSAAEAVTPQTRYRILLNNLETNLVKTKIPAGTYSEYICAALGYCFAPVTITKTGLLAGETAIINFYHKEVSDGHSEEPYMQLVMFNDTGIDSAKVEKQINLLPGTWTLVESNWGWTYTGSTEGETGSKTVDGQAAIVRKNLLDTSPAEDRTFNFYNRKSNKTSPAQESIKTNVMKPKQ
ncbi:MAG: hypothetical protein ACI3Y4_01080 [Candidatus Cryptobacteroides sp.]